MKTALRLLAFLAPFRWWVCLAVALGAATVASNMGLLGMAAYLIAAAALKPLLILLTLPIYIVRFLGVTRAASRYAERLVGHNVTFRLLAGLRTWAYGRLVPLAPARLLEYRSGDVLARLVGDVEELQHLYLGVVAPVVVAVAIVALTFGLFAIFDRTLAWTAVAFLVAAGVAVPLGGLALGRGPGERQRAVRAELNAHVVDGIQGVQDILACGRPADQVARIAALDDALGHVQRRMALVGALQQSLHDLAMNVALWTVLVLAIPLVAARTIDGVYLAFLALIILAAFEAVQPLGPAFAALGRSVAAGERVLAVAAVAPSVVEPAHPLPATWAVEPARPLVVPSMLSSAALEFDGVHFAYDPATGNAPHGEAANGNAAGATTDSEVLRGVSISLPAGGRVAVVGPSGAGKSTLVRLALRFWDPTHGAVRLAGHDVRDYALDDLRAAIGVVTQDTYIFDDTLRANLLLARPNATEAEIMQALEGAQLAAFVRGSPAGLDTWVGEHGMRLSGGERQRLAIARALLKDAPLLILDEATANLDPVTERALLDALDALMAGRTTLLITHRLVAMERMDQIVVLDRGRIVERGTHAELRAAHGLYRQLLDLQEGTVAV